MRGRSSLDYEESYNDGDVIVREGEESREMFVIQRGSVAVLKQIAGAEVEISRLHRGDFFGEMSLLESLPRSATIRAVGETRLLVIRPGSLQLKIRRNPTFAFEMLQKMSHRLRVLNDRLAELLSSEAVSGETSGDLASLRAIAEYSRARESGS